MAHVSGPTSSLPGSAHGVPDGMMCDDHPDRLAVRRIQGETDSFGAEYHDLCQECLDAHRAAVAAADHTGTCEWCGTSGVRVRPRRDYEEGMCGRVYDVCDACIKRENERVQEELDAYDDGRDCWDDLGDDHDEDDALHCEDCSDTGWKPDGKPCPCSFPPGWFEDDDTSAAEIPETV